MLTSRTALVVCLLAAAGCGKGKGQGQSSGAEASATAAPAVAAADPGPVALPAATRVVIEINVARLAASPLARALADQALSRDADARARLDALLAHCHIDVAR